MPSRLSLAVSRISSRDIVLAAIALSIVMVHWAPGSWNDTSRMATVQALVEHGTFAIDRTDFAETGDRVFIDGQFYSDKPPYPSLIGAIVYFPLFHMGVSLSGGRSAAYYLITAFTMKACLLLALWCFYRTLRFTGLDERQRLLLTAVLALGSLMLPWTAVFNNHGLAASFVTIGFCAIVEARHSEKPLLPITLAGFFLSLAAVCDVPTGAIYAAFGMLVVTNPALRRYTAAYVAPCLVTLAPYLLINYSISGSVLPVQIHKAYFDYPGSYWTDSRKLSGISVNGPGFFISYAWGCLFGRNGFVLYNPLLLIAVPMLVLEIRRRGAFRREAWAIAAAVSAIFIYYVTVTTNEGGWSFSIRWFVPFLPLLYFYLYAFLGPAARLQRYAFFALAALSVAVAAIGFVDPWSNRSLSTVSLVSNIKTAEQFIYIHYLHFIYQPIARWVGL